MENNYTDIFFIYLYRKLNLRLLDEKLRLEHIKSLPEEEGVYPISEYFSLLNIGDSGEFDESEKQEYAFLFSKDLNTLLSEEWYSKAVNFIERTYQRFFHLNDEVKYVYYGPKNNSFMAPSDCIVLGLNYNKFDLPDDEHYDEELNRQDKVVCQISNYIQFELAKMYNIKLATLRYNEVTLSQQFTML